MFVSIVSAGLALTLSFAISDKASRLGPAVAARFLERGAVIPPTDAALTAEELAQWLREPKQASSRWLCALRPPMGSRLSAGAGDLSRERLRRTGRWPVSARMD